jgi:penicillin-binding protein 2
LVYGYILMISNNTPSRKWTASLACWLLLLLVACSGSDGDQSGLPVLPVLVQQSPVEVAQTFLDAWNTNDYPAMYALVSSQSRERYPQSVFEARYTQVSQALSISGVTYTMGETTLQGTTAAVNYDVSIASSGYDVPVVDNGRIMRLIDENGTWRVAWSSMDILSGYADGAEIRVESRRPPRGTIYDRNGLPLVGEDGDVIAMWSSQQNMSDVEGCITLLATTLREWRPHVAQRFAANLFESVFFLGELDAAIYNQYSGDLQTLCGVSPGTNLFYQYTRRLYDWDGAAVHVTGYLGQVTAEDIARGYSAGDLIGQAGVEYAYEDELSGTPSRVVSIVADGVTIRELVSSEGTEASSVTLTLDLGLQRATAQAMSDAFNYAAGNWAQFATGAAAIVIDVNTGEILALASYPGFDPALFDPNSAIPVLDRGEMNSAIINSTLRPAITNRATQESYFPGSTFKIITASATAAEGLISPTEMFDCQFRWDGRPYGDTREFRVDWRASEEDMEPAGEINISQALAASCNPFFYQYGALLYRDVGFQSLMQYAQRMGLGAATGLGNVMQEVAAPLPTIDNPEEALMSAVGQYDVQVTAIQMVRMMAGVANGGTLYRPYVVQRVGGIDGQPITFEAESAVVGNFDFAPEVYQVIHEGLCLATTDELGTSWFVFEGIPYTVCGKTGTAQTGTPYPNGWFVAYAPADNPQVAIVAVVPNSREGSETAAPIVRRILDYYFNAPVAEFPDWWFNNTYNVMDLPEGSTGG